MNGTSAARRLLASIVLIAAPRLLTAQPANPQATVSLGDRGIVFTIPDARTELTLRTRIQEHFTVVADEDLGRIQRVGMQVRRLRLGLAGTTVDPRLRFNVQLSFARGDMDLEGSGFPNVVRDATVAWQLTPAFQVMAGQTKLPGNRQRVNSSSEIEYPDRSIVNALFNIDRDVGIWGQYVTNAASGPLTIRASLTGGEGRNQAVGDAGLAYTGRVEWHPLGAFAANGAYTEGDLQREPAARLAIGATHSVNERTTRTAGQLGLPLFAPRTLRSSFVDVLFKRRGLAASAEYALRTADDPVTRSGDAVRAVFAGHGVTAQVSYQLPGGYAPGFRVARVVPHRDIAGTPGALRSTQTSAVLTRYFKGHKVKMAFEFGYDDVRDPFTRMRTGSVYQRTGIELGL